MLIYDYIRTDKLTSRTITPEGYLSATAALTKVGVQDYDLSQITGNPRDTGKVVGVFRSPEVVFSDATINSIKMKPITLQHPPESVTSDNFKMYSIGMVGETVNRIDNTRLAANILVTDKGMVNDIQNGKIKQISLGYEANFIESQGEYDGKTYQYAFNGSMIVNHCAIVDDGRCGETVSILDNNGVKKNMTVKENAIIEDKNKKSSTDEDNIDDKSKKDAEPDDDEPVTQDDDMMTEEDKAKVAKAKKKKAIEMKTDSSIDIQKMIQDGVDKRISAISLASFFVKDTDEFRNLKDRQILEKAYKEVMGNKADVKDKSDDHIIGTLEYAAKSMKDSKTQRDEISVKVKDSSSSGARIFSAIEIKNLGA